MSVIPSYRTVVIGIRNPQERVIYPLSWHDLKQLQHIISSIVAGCVNLADSGYTQEQLYQYVLTKISDHVVEVLNLVVEGDPVDERDISIEQVSEVALIVYDMNFEVISKNVKSLLQKKNLLKKA